MQGDGSSETKYFGGEDKYNESVPWTDKKERADWIRVGTWQYYRDNGLSYYNGAGYTVHRDFSDINNCISGTNYAGKSSGLKKKFNDYV